MKGRIIGLAVALFVACLAVIPALAQPPVLPCTWWGSVTFDGNPVADGTAIVAKVGTTVVGTTTTDGSDYSMVVPQEGGVPAEGATVNFYVVIGGVQYLGGTDIWNAGALKELNLAAVSGPKYTLTINVNPAGAGTTNPAPGGHTYDAGTVVTITATANPGYAFSQWSGDASGTNPTVQVTMNANKTVTANFVAVYTLTVNVSPAGAGSVSRNPNLAEYPAGTVVTLTATPSSGYQFSHWSGDLTGSANPATITVNSNKTVTANFVESAVPTTFMWWLYETFIVPLRG